MHCYSNVVFRAYARQSSVELGAGVWVTATLDEYAVPVDYRASVWADITRPDGSIFALQMPEGDAGRFEGSFQASLCGLYIMRVRAVGTTIYGSAFQREQTLSAAVYPGGDRVADAGDVGGIRLWCQLVDCLKSTGVLRGRLAEMLKELGVDFDVFLECVQARCRELGPLGETVADNGSGTCRVLETNRIQRIAEIVARELRAN